ncbi:MAG: hypothetical protein ACK5KO_03550 [Arachnia sp.]
MSERLDDVLASLRPLEADVAAELSFAKQAAILQEVMGVRLARSPLTWFALAAAVVLVAGGGVVIALDANGRQDVADVTPPTQTQRPTSSTPTGSPSQDVAVANAGIAADLDRPAEGALGQPGLAPGEFLHVMSVQTNCQNLAEGDTDPYCSIESRDLYISDDGWSWTKIERSADDVTWFKGSAEYVDVNGLPTDPAALDAALRSGTSGNSGDGRVFSAITEILGTEAASPELRSAAILVLKGIAENPSAPETGREGVVARPAIDIEVYPGAVGEADQIWVVFTDEGVMPGGSIWLALDADTGLLIRSGSDGGGSESSDDVISRDVIDELPADVVEALGTERDDKEVE